MEERADSEGAGSGNGIGLNGGEELELDQDLTNAIQSAKNGKGTEYFESRAEEVLKSFSAFRVMLSVRESSGTPSQ